MITDHGENDPLDPELGEAWDEVARQIRIELQMRKARELYLVAERQFHANNKGDA